jgi:precorrin-3B synthase
VAVAFGQLPAETLAWLAERTDRPLRITPWRALVIETAERAAIAAHPDLIAAPSHPLAAVAACTGAPGCPQGHGDARALARRLAGRTGGRALHVSGCAKGCARPSPSALTVVAGRDGWALVREGAPWDEPFARGLSADDVASRLR